MKPLFTKAGPPLSETLPDCCGPLANCLSKPNVAEAKAKVYCIYLYYTYVYYIYYIYRVSQKSGVLHSCLNLEKNIKSVDFISGS